VCDGVVADHVCPCPVWASASAAAICYVKVPRVRLSQMKVLAHVGSADLWVMIADILRAALRSSTPSSAAPKMPTMPHVGEACTPVTTGEILSRPAILVVWVKLSACHSRCCFQASASGCPAEPERRRGGAR
jgi:hypothetical protein